MCLTTYRTVRCLQVQPHLVPHLGHSRDPFIGGLTATPGAMALVGAIVGTAACYGQAPGRSWQRRRLSATPRTAMPRSRRVAVVGGGPAGAVSGRFLAEAGHEPVILERGSGFGGIWAKDPTNRVVYQNLITNIPQACMQSFDLDFPSHLPSFVKGTDLGQYVCSFAATFGVEKFTRFDADVVEVKPLVSEAEDALGESAWRVTWASAGDGAATTTEDFDAIVVATGHYEAPYEPEVPGQADWLAASPSAGARTVVHSRDYQEPSSYASQVVLVVGGRSSAVDLARELRPVARWVYVLEKSCEEARTVGNCTHVPLGSTLASDGHLRLKGATLAGPAVDTIILATGYTYSFPFLDGVHLDFGAARRYVAPLYMHTVHAQRPSLCFIGIPLAVPCPIPLFEAQARFVAAHLREAHTSTEEREEWVASRRKVVGERSQDMHFFQGDDAYQHMRDLTWMAGMRGPEYDAYCKRVATVAAIHADRSKRRPLMPWDDDVYRSCEYTVDWDSGNWTVADGSVERPSL